VSFVKRLERLRTRIGGIDSLWALRIILMESHQRYNASQENEFAKHLSSTTAARIDSK